MLARVDQAPRPHHPRGVYQHGVGQLRDLVGQAERTREHVGREAVPLDEGRVLLARAVRREHEPQALARPRGQGARHRQDLLAHGAGGRDEDEQGVAAVRVRPAHAQGRAVEGRELHGRRGLADARRLAPDPGTHRRHAIVQQADLARQRHHHRGQRQHDDPEHHVRDDERFAHDARELRAARCAPAISPSAAR
jgi:hypothetical protein